MRKKEIIDFLDKEESFLEKIAIFIKKYFILILSLVLGLNIIIAFYLKNIYLEIAEPNLESGNKNSFIFDDIIYFENLKKESNAIDLDNRAINIFSPKKEEIENGQSLEGSLKKDIEQTATENGLDFTEIKSISINELESLLAKTLFDFYQENKEDMPLISERALIWESLGLGNSREYRGTYNQNIIFLETLKEKLDNL